MAKTFKSYMIRFQERATSNHWTTLNFAFRNLFSVIPASIGHFFDTLLGIDGLIVEDKDEPMSGPFGFIFGFFPFVAGVIVGQILDIALKLPSLILHYLIDLPIGWILNKIADRLSEATLNSPFFFFCRQAADAIRGFISFITNKPPKEMSGVCGFTVGIVPHIIRYGLMRLCDVITSSISFVVDKAAKGIRHLKKPSPSKNGQNDDAEEPTPEQPAPEEPKRPRFRRPGGKGENNTPGQAQDDVVGKVIAEGVDLFEVLGVTAQQYKDAEDPAKLILSHWRKKCVNCHPDKNPEQDAAKAKQWEDLSRAKEILEDRNNPKANAYLSHYEKTHPDLRFFSAPKPQAARPASVRQASVRASTSLRAKSIFTDPAAPAPAPANNGAEPAVSKTDGPFKRVIKRGAAN